LGKATHRKKATHAVPSTKVRLGATPSQGSVGFEFQAMSSVCEIRLDGTDSAAMTVAAQNAITEVRRIEKKYSRYLPDSIISRINKGAGSAAVFQVDDETASLLNFAASLHTLSDGLFDITSGVLRRVWDFRAGSKPSAADLKAILPLIDWNKVEWHAPAIRLPTAGMELDFGGFGKEYAADRAMAVLLASGQHQGFINLGGDIRVLGARCNGLPWRFGIAHPRKDAATIASVELTDGALASSGDYERYFEVEGQRFCHILNPQTGMPVNKWASVSVTAPACVAAGALSTIAMLKGEDALAFLATQGATFLAVDTQLQLFHHELPNAQQFISGQQ
jgi:FAD:protein FMN transferase